MLQKQIIIKLIGISLVTIFLIRAQDTVKHITAQDEKILQRVEKKKGFRPNPLVLMSKRNGVLSSFMNYANGIFNNGPLSEKEVYLAALSAAVALKSPICTEAHAKSALANGATKEEVNQTILIAGVISNTSPLHLAGGVLNNKSQIPNE